MVFPSPAGVGVIAETRISLPRAGRSRNAWSDTLAVSEVEYCPFAARSGCDELSPSGSRNEVIAGPSIGLHFLVSAIARFIVDENAFLAVEQDMCGFMKEAEPQMVV